MNILVDSWQMITYCGLKIVYFLGIDKYKNVYVPDLSFEDKQAMQLRYAGLADRWFGWELMGLLGVFLFILVDDRGMAHLCLVWMIFSFVQNRYNEYARKYVAETLKTPTFYSS